MWQTFDPSLVRSEGGDSLCVLRSPGMDRKMLHAIWLCQTGIAVQKKAK